MILVLVVIEFIIGGSMSKHNNENNNSTNKIFKTLDEQIEVLKSKGLVIDDVDSAKEILLRENYFFLEQASRVLDVDPAFCFVDGRAGGYAW